jgi:hypothetical protein
MSKAKEIQRDGPCIIEIRQLGTIPGMALGYKPWRAHSPIGLTCQVVKEMVDVYAHLFEEDAARSNTDPKTYLRANITAYLLSTFAKPQTIVEMAQQITKPMMDFMFGNIPLPEPKQEAGTP